MHVGMEWKDGWLEGWKAPSFHIPLFHSYDVNWVTAYDYVSFLEPQSKTTSGDCCQSSTLLLFI